MCNGVSLRCKIQMVLYKFFRRHSKCYRFFDLCIYKMLMSCLINIISICNIVMCRYSFFLITMDSCTDLECLCYNSFFRWVFSLIWHTKVKYISSFSRFDSFWKPSIVDPPCNSSTDLTTFTNYRTRPSYKYVFINDWTY